MIVGWIRRDGMARIGMTGVVSTPLSGACISWNLLVNYYGMSEIVGQLLFEQYTNEQPLAILPK